MRLCFCAFPWASQAGRVHPLTVTRIIQPLTGRLWVVARLKADDLTQMNNTTVYSLSPAVDLVPGRSWFWVNALKWAVAYLRIQAQMTYYVARVANKADAVLFYEGPHYILPALVARLLGKRVIKYTNANLIATMSGRKLHPLSWVASYIFRVLDRFVLTLSHKIVVPTSYPDISFSMGRKRNISEAMYACVGNEFRELKDWKLRDDIAGYVGRLTEVKGVLQLARAVPLIAEKKKVRFLIVGDGPLMPEMRRLLAKLGCLDMVEFTGWVPEEGIPFYLNQMKFHILPSYHDFPGIINLEAMACGTVAIANKVDGVLSIIIDGKTGFLMEGNEPEIIASKLLETWDSPLIEQVRQNSLTYVRERFSNQSVTAAWARVFD